MFYISIKTVLTPKLSLNNYRRRNMQLQITARHTEHTAALDQFIKDKFEKLDKYFDNHVSTHIIISVDKHSHTCEANINVPGNHLFATTDANNMYTAIDTTLDKLTQQVKKYKSKLKDHGHCVPKKEFIIEPEET